MSPSHSPEALLCYKVTVGCSGLRSAFVESVWSLILSFVGRLGRMVDIYTCIMQSALISDSSCHGVKRPRHITMRLSLGVFNCVLVFLTSVRRIKLRPLPLASTNSCSGHFVAIFGTSIVYLLPHIVRYGT